ncbi:hypothetical protein IHE45_18G043900 [Dioscorea alata]|uniref:Uncharacterized protein n=1 Tax=Dioscorea alata TaxID=55571 RepID=A0ACB7U6I0_DIOAL|nr:hypothetical protein IHE45_18G043900 [Dioscorea alata]
MNTPSSCQLLILILVVSSMGGLTTARPMRGEWWTWPEELGLLLESLPKGPVTPSGPSGCTNNPNNNGGSCPIP